MASKHGAPTTSNPFTEVVEPMTTELLRKLVDAHNHVGRTAANDPYVAAIEVELDRRRNEI